MPGSPALLRLNSRPPSKSSINNKSFYFFEEKQNLFVESLQYVIAACGSHGYVPRRLGWIQIFEGCPSFFTNISPNVECLKKKEFSYRHLAQLRMLKFLMQCCHIPFNQLKQVNEMIMETAAEPLVDGSAVPDDELKLVVTASHFPPDFHQCLSRRAV
ncbi:unnamed protein product [Linum tenue]|nr:unnamed protein product [Linum tenue]